MSIRNEIIKHQVNLLSYIAQELTQLTVTVKIYII